LRLSNDETVSQRLGVPGRRDPDVPLALVDDRSLVDYPTFLNRVIDDGIEAVKEDYARSD
jgi:hypothetical protein